jgi:hypothetical protein
MSQGSAATAGYSVLIIEDVDQKHDEVKAVVANVLPINASFSRARTVVEAQDAIEADNWSLIVVDISMDIADSGGAKTREGHANLGGIDIIEQMYLLERDAPTVIVTGFDYFIRSSREHEQTEAQTFGDLSIRAKNWLGDKFLGCVRYGKAGWEERLKDALQGAIR